MAPNRCRNDHTEGVSRTRRRSTPWLVTAVGGDAIAYRDAFVALFVAVIASLVAGITLATTTDTLEELPGLLLLVPAALDIDAMMGTYFGGDMESGFAMSGQVQGRIDAVRPVADVLREAWDDCQSVLRTLGAAAAEGSISA